eukprot:9474638-Pyramimonas_sp.AAC.1
METYQKVHGQQDRRQADAGPEGLRHVVLVRHSEALGTRIQRVLAGEAESGRGDISSMHVPRSAAGDSTEISDR